MSAEAGPAEVSLAAEGYFLAKAAWWRGVRGNQARLERAQQRLCQDVGDRWHGRIDAARHKILRCYQNGGEPNLPIGSLALVAGVAAGLRGQTKPERQRRQSEDFFRHRIRRQVYVADNQHLIRLWAARLAPYLPPSCLRTVREAHDDVSARAAAIAQHKALSSQRQHGHRIYGVSVGSTGGGGGGG